MKLLCYLMLVALMGFAIIPRDSFSDTVTVNGPAKHIAAFLVLAWLLDRAYPTLSRGTKIILLIAYGGLIELVQAFVPYRACNPFDLLMDSVGIAAYFIYAAIRRRFGAG
jgi:glycopeptide antibiotics resistance protein